MTRRRLLLVAMAWIVAYLLGYVVVLGRQGDASPAWWYVGLLDAVLATLGFVVAGVLAQRSLVASAVALAMAALVALLSIGVLLVPAVVLVVLAAGRSQVP